MPNKKLSVESTFQLPLSVERRDEAAVRLPRLVERKWSFDPRKRPLVFVALTGDGIPVLSFDDQKRIAQSPDSIRFANTWRQCENQSATLNGPFTALRIGRRAPNGHKACMILGKCDSHRRLLDVEHPRADELALPVRTAATTKKENTGDTDTEPAVNERARESETTATNWRLRTDIHPSGLDQLPPNVRGERRG